MEEKEGGEEEEEEERGTRKEERGKGRRREINLTSMRPMFQFDKVLCNIPVIYLTGE